MNPSANHGKLAVLMPVYNGGEVFLKSIASCAESGLAADQYQLIVVDNCSTDGIPDLIPERDPQGALIQLVRNERNLGRVGNWTRAMEIALEQGFELVTFLFAGDVWLANGSLPKLLSLMEQSEAAIGFASMHTITMEGILRSHFAPLPVAADHVITSTVRIFEEMLKSAHFPLGPLQANVYRLRSIDDLPFDAERARTTDVDATIHFLLNRGGPAAIVRDPFFAWRERADRFHFTMDVEVQVKDKIDIFERARAHASIKELNARRALSRLLLVMFKMTRDYARGRKLAALYVRLLATFFSQEVKPSPYWFLRGIYDKVVLRRRILNFEQP